MGNACRKNAPKQVTEPQKVLDEPVIARTPEKIPSPTKPDESDLKELEELNAALLRQKQALEEELKKWHETHQSGNIEEEIKQLKEELNMTNETGGLDLTSEGEAGEEQLQVQLKQCLEEWEREELQILEARLEYFNQELVRINEAHSNLEVEAADAQAEAAEVATMTEKFSNGEPLIREEDEAEIRKKAEKKRLAAVASHFNLREPPKNAGECANMFKVDVANCSSQTVRNLKALGTNLRTCGQHPDYYLTRQIQGVVCDAFQCGMEPHPLRECELCRAIDASDAPLLI